MKNKSALLFFFIITLFVIIFSSCRKNNDLKETIEINENKILALELQITNSETELLEAKRLIEFQEEEAISYTNQINSLINDLKATTLELEKIKIIETKRVKGNTTVGIDNKVIVGDIISEIDYYEIIFTNYYFSTDVLPSNRSKSYSYYEGSGSDFKYIIICGMFENMNNTELQVEDIINDIEVVYDNKYRYLGNSTNENEKRNGFFGGIKPLLKSYFYIFAEIPSKIENTDYSLVMNFKINNNKYSMNLRITH